MTQISQLPDRDFKITMVNMLKETEEKMVKIGEMMDKTDEKRGISTEIWGKKRKIKWTSTTEERI